MDQDIGYYPETKFNTRFPEAHYVEMGGRVLDSRPGGKHTTTPMGSGMLACGGSRFAATIMEYFGIATDGTRPLPRPLPATLLGHWGSPV
jgi:hypothetical protein